MKRAIFAGVALAAGWQLLHAVKSYRTIQRKKAERAAITTWEGEGGRPQPQPPASSTRPTR